MNRRGFFATLAALPALLRGKLPLPLPVPTAPAMLGMEAWLPATPSGESFFGIDRSVEPASLLKDLYSRGQAERVYREALIEASNEMLRRTR